MSDELYDLVGLDEGNHEAVEAVADAEAVADLITTLVGVRKDFKVSQKSVADRMGTTQSAVSEIERIATDPHISTLQRYGRALGARIALRVVLDGGWTKLHGNISAATSGLNDPDLASSHVETSSNWEPLFSDSERVTLQVVC